jgi:hypothetical protein
MMKRYSQTRAGRLYFSEFANTILPEDYEASD